MYVCVCLCEIERYREVFIETEMYRGRESECEERERE